MSNHSQKERLLMLMQEILAHDDELREKFEMGNKFRFIRDRLQSLLTKVEEDLVQIKDESDVITFQPLEDEIAVYVYLFNAQGAALQTWHKMLQPRVFYEYSVNRPIYTDKPSVEAFIRTKSNRLQHGFLTVFIKKDSLINPEPALKDALGNPVMKVREGSLKVDRLFAFTHNNVDYTVDAAGELKKKN